MFLEIEIKLLEDHLKRNIKNETRIDVEKLLIFAYQLQNEKTMVKQTSSKIEIKGESCSCI